MSEKPIHGLTCANCNGMVPIPEGVVIVTCPYCDMRSLVKGERGLRRYQVPRAIEREHAQKALSNFLSGKFQVARNAASKSKVQEIFLTYVPFWARWARAMGWFFGQEQVGSGDNRRYEAREIKVAEEMTWNGVALDVGEFGVEQISLERKPLEAFDADALHAAGMVFEPVGSASDAKETADRDFRNRLVSLASLDRTAQNFIRFAKQRLGLVYYPLWVVRYLYRGRSFQVVVDGHDGELLYGKAPGSTLFRSIALVAGMALGALIAVDGSALMTYLMFTADDDSLGLGVAALAALGFGFAIMMWGYRAFRYGEQYEYRKGGKKSRRTRTKKEGDVRRIREVTG